MNERLDSLLQLRAAAISGMRGLLDAAESRGGLNADDKAELAKREAEIEDLDTRIASTRKLDTLEASLRETQIPGADARTEGGSESEYREVFMSYVRTGVVSTDEAKILRNGFVGEDFETRDQTKAVNANGGYIVPPTFEKTLLARAIEFSVMRQVIGDAMETGNGSTITLPKEGAIGSAAWLDESAAFVESDDQFGQATLSAWKAGRLVKATLELLEDAFFDVEKYLANSIGQTIGILESAAFVSGDGTKKPRGFILDAQVGVTTPLPLAIAGRRDHRPRLLRASVLPGEREVRRQRRRRPHPSQAEGRERPVSLAGQRPERSDAGRAPASLLGYPVYTEVNMPVVAATSKSVAFGDFSRYQIRDVAASGSLA
jgi:HK97 family phage major capsid protein